MLHRHAFAALAGTPSLAAPPTQELTTPGFCRRVGLASPSVGSAKSVSATRFVVHGHALGGSGDYPVVAAFLAARCSARPSISQRRRHPQRFPLASPGAAI